MKGLGRKLRGHILQARRLALAPAHQGIVWQLQVQPAVALSKMIVKIAAARKHVKADLGKSL